MTVLGAGAPAPSFRLVTEDQQDFTQAHLQGTTTVLVFYPFAFSPVCTDQLVLYEEVREDLAGRGVDMYGVSCDSTHAQHAFREHLGVTIAQLSDFEPKGATSSAFGVLHPGGFSERALVITGPDAGVRFSYQASSPNELPGVNLLYDGLAAV